jgi:hypothetical protein
MRKDWFSAVKSHTQAFTRALVSISCFALPIYGLAAEQAHTNSLENYLKKLQYAPIAFRYERNCPLMEGKIGARKCVFAISTGENVTMLDSGAAKGLKTLKDLGVTLEDRFIDRLSNTSVVIMDKVLLGGVEFANQPAALRRVDADFVRLPFEGMLGLDFLYRNYCLLDCAAHRLYVRPEKPSADVSRALEETLLRSGFTNVTLRHDSFLALDARVNGQPIEMAVDIGSTLSLLDQSEAKRLELQGVKRQRTGSWIAKQTTFVTVNVGKEGSHKTYLMKLNSLEVAGVNWQTLYFGVMNLKDLPEDTNKGKPPQGTLAPDILAPQDAVLDFATRKLWFAQQTVARKHGWD